MSSAVHVRMRFRTLALIVMLIVAASAVQAGGVVPPPTALPVGVSPVSSAQVLAAVSTAAHGGPVAPILNPPLSNLAGSTGRRNASVSRQHQLSLTEGDGDGKAVHR